MISASKISALDTIPFIDGVNFKSKLLSRQPNPITFSHQNTKALNKRKSFPRFILRFFDFNFEFDLEIININDDFPKDKIILTVKFEENIIAVSLLGKRKKNAGFYINDFDFRVIKQGESPTSVFLLKSLWAAMVLSKKTEIEVSEFNLKATMSFDLKVNEISDLLQIRKIAYRAMVIEKTFNLKLPFPEFIDGKDIENIAYCYHSIIVRKFEWFSSPTIASWFATQDYLSLLPKKNIPFRVQDGPRPFIVEILGLSIDLGLQIAWIKEYVVENFETVKKELSKLDGKEVLVNSYSKNGIVEIESVTTPFLPENAFDNRIQKLIDLDEKFNNTLFDKYLNSFPNSFEGLTEEQIENLIERPNLDIEAFNF